MNVWNVNSVSGSQIEYQHNSGDLDENSNDDIEIFNYEIRDGRYIYQATIVKDSVSEMDRVSFGGRKKNCVQYSVYWDDEEKLYPNLDGLNYNEKCTINSDLNLEKKHGTIRMLKASLKFLCHIYPDINGILFKDYSVMKCLENVRISLSEFYIAKYGYTWYQDKFSAVPYDNPNYYNELQELNRTLDKPLTLSFKDFYDTFVKGRIRGFRKKYNIVKDIYESSTSFRDFIKNLHRNIPDCQVLSGWLSYYMSQQCFNSLNLHHMFFAIKKETIEGWILNINVNKLD
jgi:hypothetical protein